MLIIHNMLHFGGLLFTSCITFFRQHCTSTKTRLSAWKIVKNWPNLETIGTKINDQKSTKLFFVETAQLFENGVQTSPN